MGQGEKATVGAFLIDLGSQVVGENMTIQENDTNLVKNVLLHPEDEDSIMIDSFTLVNRVMHSITFSTVCNRLVTYKFFLDDHGNWKTTEELQDTSQLKLSAI